MNRYLETIFWFGLLLTLASCADHSSNSDPVVVVVNDRFAITGKITGDSGPLEGVTVAITNSAANTTVTDSDGNFLFDNLPAGSYTLTPTKTNFTFLPSSMTVVVGQADVPGRDFTAMGSWAKGYLFSGNMPQPQFDKELRFAETTADGGYIAAGEGGAGAWLAKLDTAGNIQWQKAYAVERGGQLTGFTPSSDGGYVLAGTVMLVPDSQQTTAWVIKVDANGDIEWGKTYSAGGWEEIIYSVQQTSDGGYVFAGHTQPSTGGQRAWLFKTDANGNVQWQRAYARSPRFTAVRQTADGGYIAAGESGEGAWLAKLDTAGNIQWQYSYDWGTQFNRFLSVSPTSDGEYIAAGSYQSVTPPPLGIGCCSSYHTWLLVVRFAPAGDIRWYKSYGKGTVQYSTGLSSIQQTSDGGYIAGGEFQECERGLALRLDSVGNTQWSKGFAGIVNCIQATPDGGYVGAGGYLSSPDSHYWDPWIVKMNDDGSAGSVAQTCNLSPDTTHSVDIHRTSAVVVDAPISTSPFLPTVSTTEAVAIPLAP